MPSPHARQSGFSLIEIIAALVVVGLMAALLLPLTGTGLRGELDQDSRLQQAEDLRSRMDGWLHTHRDPDAPANGADMVAFRQLILDSSLPAGTSIESLEWIRFDAAGQPVPGTDEDILKVTLTNGQSRLSSFFPPIHP
jgi:prepilin-type N-terminal cleavage/methylation domain-containing protein